MKITTIVIVPGFTETIESRNYALLIKMLTERGYKVIFHTPDWQGEAAHSEPQRDDVVSGWIEGLVHACRDLTPENTILAGFSYGAFICLGVAAEWQPAKLWTGTPYPVANDRHRQFARRLSRETETTLMIGEEEFTGSPGFRRISRELWQMIPGARFFQAEGAGHNVTHPGYLEAIRRTL